VPLHAKQVKFPLKPEPLQLEQRIPMA
jgi:hypothetical protein